MTWPHSGHVQNMYNGRCVVSQLQNNVFHRPAKGQHARRRLGQPRSAYTRTRPGLRPRWGGDVCDMARWSSASLSECEASGLELQSGSLSEWPRVLPGALVVLNLQSPAPTFCKPHVFYATPHSINLFQCNELKKNKTLLAAQGEFRNYIHGINCM